LLDYENHKATDEIKLVAYLPLTNKLPIILGFKDLLEKFKINADYQNNQAWLENVS
jgi:hypothetical protein